MTLLSTHVVIGFDEPRYYVALFATLAFYLGLNFLTNKVGAGARHHIIRMLGASYLFLMLVNQPIFLFGDGYQWDVHIALPLHLCSVSFLLIGINSFLQKRWIWEMTLFFGVIGGFHSLLTPELAEGDSPYFFFFYYYKHGAILFIPFLHHKAWGFALTKRSWLRLFAYANGYMVVTFVINWTLNSFFPEGAIANYFYTWEPPSANNPIIQGNWPWYLIPCEIALIVHLLLIQFGFNKFVGKKVLAA